MQISFFRCGRELRTLKKAVGRREWRWAKLKKSPSKYLASSLSLSLSRIISQAQWWSARPPSHQDQRWMPVLSSWRRSRQFLFPLSKFRRTSRKNRRCQRSSRRMKVKSSDFLQQPSSQSCSLIQTTWKSTSLSSPDSSKKVSTTLKSVTRSRLSSQTVIRLLTSTSLSQRKLPLWAQISLTSQKTRKRRRISERRRLPKISGRALGSLSKD